MGLLQRMTAREPIDAALRAAIESIPNRGNPTQALDRVFDVRAMQAIADVIDSPRLVCATSNAALALLPLQRLPSSVSRVEHARAECLDAAIGWDRTTSRTHTMWSPRPAPEVSWLLLDAMDCADHLEALRAEFASGGIRRVLIFNALRSWVRRWIERHAEGLEVEHLVASQGLVAISRTESDDFEGWAAAIDELAAESELFPPRLDLTVEAGRTHHGLTDNLTSLVRLDHTEYDRRLLEQLLQNSRDTTAEIREFLFEAYAPMTLHPLAFPEHLEDGTFETTIVPALSGADDRSEACAAAVFGAWRQRLFESVRELDRRLAADPASMAVLFRVKSVLHYLKLMREMAWWARFWEIESNSSWRPILERKCPAGTLLPKPVTPLEQYLNFYWLDGTSGERIDESAPEPVSASREAARTPMPALGQLNHTARKHSAAHVCGFLLSRLAARYPEGPIRWLDVGGGDGWITNGADVPPWVADRLEVVGLEFGEKQVRVAKSLASKGRRFEVVNALAPPEHLLGTKFHLISAFEFLEHLLDPADLIRQYMVLDPDFFVAGSPLDEAQPFLPTQQHTWSFSREGYEAIFREAGLEPTYSTENRIGTYTGGHDWLTLVGAAKGVLEIDFDGPVRQVEAKALSGVRQPGPAPA